MLAFDKTTLEAKLAVVMDDSNFKIVTLKVWDRTKDPRPVVPVIEAARITQGKLQFYTPNLEVDPEPVHDKEFVVVAALGGSQVCWTTDPGMLKDSGSQPRSAEAGPGAAGDIGRRR